MTVHEVQERRTAIDPLSERGRAQLHILYRDVLTAIGKTKAGCAHARAALGQ